MTALATSVLPRVLVLAALFCGTEYAIKEGIEATRYSVPPEALIETSATDDSSVSSVPRAGRVVGILERWLLTTLVVIGQFGLIGLVLTAKSVARYSKISDDPAFAEYYLLGTMYSTLMAVVAGLALRPVIGGMVL